MADYQVRIKASAQKELEALEYPFLDRIFARIELLAREPRPAGVKKLKGFRDLWRLRAGDYRIVYAIDDKAGMIDVLRIAHRREAYD